MYELYYTRYQNTFSHTFHRQVFVCLCLQKNFFFSVYIFSFTCINIYDVKYCMLLYYILGFLRINSYKGHLILSKYSRHENNLCIKHENETLYNITIHYIVYVMLLCAYLILIKVVFVCKLCTRKEFRCAFYILFLLLD